MAFQNSCFEIGHCPCRVSLHCGFCILYHNHSIFIVCIGYSESTFGKSIKECFLRIAVVFECFVIVKMITCKINIERDLIKATHDGREINVRGIKFGFNTIVTVATDGGSSGTDAISKNWNKFLKQIEEASTQKQETSIWSEIG